MNHAMRCTIKTGSLLAAVVLLFLISSQQMAAAKEKTVAEPTPAAVKTLVLVLFDVSSGSATDEIRNRYLNSFDQILKSLSGGEVLLGERITDNPLATASLPLNVEFPASKNARRLDRLRMNARMTVEGWLKDAKSSPRTDVLGAFQWADKVINGENYKNLPHKIVVVFSDMVQESTNCNFVSDQLTSDSAKRLIDSERAASRLPNLKGVDVWVVGATAATQGGLDPDRINRIQDFWLQYLTETGAKIDTSRYAATLMNFSIAKPSGR